MNSQRWSNLHLILAVFALAVLIYFVIDGNFEFAIIFLLLRMIAFDGFVSWQYWHNKRV